jgi:hemoglobin
LPVGNKSAYVGPVSDYERVGGAPAIRAVVNRFCELVVGDERISDLFEGTDMKALKRHQTLLVSQAMGAPARYAGRDVQEARASLRVADDHFGTVVTYLAAAMQWAGVPSEIIARVGGRLSDARRDVVSSGAY